MKRIASAFGWCRLSTYHLQVEWCLPKFSVREEAFKQQVELTVHTV